MIDRNLKSYGIMMIKPDGIQAECDKMLEKYFCNLGISVIDISEQRLTENDIGKYFYYQFDEFKKYMTSSNVKAYLLGSKGDNIAEELYEIKKKVRASYGVKSTDLKNIIHSAQSGLEFYLQKKLFFYKYAGDKFTYGRDLHVKIKDVESIDSFKALDSIKKESKIWNFILSINIEQIQSTLGNLDFDNPDIKYSVHVYKIIEKCNCEIIFFMNKECINKLRKFGNQVSLEELEKTLNQSCKYVGLGKVVFNEILSYNQRFVTKEDCVKIYEKYYFETIDPIVKKLGVNSILMDSPVFTLQEMEARGEIAIQNDLRVFGGSSDIKLFGSFGVHYHDYKELNFYSI